MIKWFKKLFGIYDLEKDIKQLEIYTNNRLEIQRQYIKETLEELKKYTRVDADVGIRGNNTIILTGVYKRQAYIRFYDLGNGEFEYLVKMLKSMKDHALIRHIDAPPDFRGFFDL